MRIVSWNIRHGGGKRAQEIVSQFVRWGPDVVALSEFRSSGPSAGIARALRDMGLNVQKSTIDDAPPRENGLLFASRYPFECDTSTGLLLDSRRWLQIQLTAPLPITLAAMHVPNRGEGRKYEFHAQVVAALQQLANRNALAFGDTNSGVAMVDEERKNDNQRRFFNRRETDWFSQIQKAGWIDVWRHRNPTGSEFTWHSRSRGFRLDQVFATTAFESRIRNAFYDWCRTTPDGPRGNQSDHAAIVIDIEEE